MALLCPKTQICSKRSRYMLVRQIANNPADLRRQIANNLPVRGPPNSTNHKVLPVMVSAPLHYLVHLQEDKNLKKDMINNRKNHLIEYEDLLENAYSKC